MRILQVNKKFPFPLHDGESVAVNQLAAGLKHAGAEIDLFALNTSRHPYDPPAGGYPEALGHYGRIWSAPIDTKLRWHALLLDIFRKGSYQFGRFYDARVARELKEVLHHNQYDVIQFESIYAASYIGLAHEAGVPLISLRNHNVEFIIWERLGKASGPGFAIYFNFLSQKIKRIECDIIQQADLLIPVSAVDAIQLAGMGYKGPIHVSPIGIMPVEYMPNTVKKPNRPPVIGFIGSLDWRPNIQGLRWFLKEIYPLIIRDMPEFLIRIAGKNMPAWLNRLADDRVEILGEVDEAGIFINQADAMVIPILSGSGTRVKAIEAFGMGVPVISTTIGIEGLSVIDGHHALLADTSALFANHIIRLFSDPNLYDRLVRNGLDLANSEHNPVIIGQKLYDEYASKLDHEGR